VKSQRPTVNLALQLGRHLLANFTGLRDHAFKAAALISKCRTSELGTHAPCCSECGQAIDDANSCRSRFCPLCSLPRSNAWLAKWQARLLHVDHWHLVFTIPHDLNFFFKLYPAQMGELFFQAVRVTLTKLLRDPQWLGARAGILMMLQTWDNELKDHPHIHVLITSGGADESGAWRGLTRGSKFFMPHLVIARCFRKTFMDLMRKAEYSGEIKSPAGWGFARRMKFLKAVAGKAFVIQIFGPYGHGVGVLKYLANHVKGGPIANSHILAVSPTHVTFRMKPRPDLVELERTLDLDMFLKRWLAHIPPPGFHVVRAFGLYSPSSKVKVTGLPASAEKEEAIPDDRPGFCPRCFQPMIVRDRGDIKTPSPHAPSRARRFPTPARASPPYGACTRLARSASRAPAPVVIQ
jgi:hypothetical protein